MTTPDDDLITLLARSLGDARLGGAGWLELAARAERSTTAGRIGRRTPGRSAAQADPAASRPRRSAARTSARFAMSNA